VIEWVYAGAAGVWGAGAVLLLAWLFFGYGWSAYLVRRSRPIGEGEAMVRLQTLCRTFKLRPPRLQASQRVRSPVLVGLWRPAILLPANCDADFTPAALQAILIHELTHLVRRDCAWNLLARVTAALLWVQPLIWKLRRELEQVSEEICDQAVLQGEVSPRAYADCLLRLAERLLPSPERSAGLGVVSCRSSLGRRIEQILDGSSRRTRPLTFRLRVGIGLAASSAMLLGLSFVSASPRPAVSTKARQIVIAEAKPTATADPSEPLTLRVTGEPVVDLLPQLPLADKARLVATPELGERRVHVLVRDLPPAKLHQALAEVVDGIWVRRSRGEQLSLEPDPGALREQEAWLRQRKQRFFAGLHSLTRQLSLDKEGIERLRKTDPAAAGYLSRPGSRTAIQLTSFLGDTEWQELEAKGRLVVPPSQWTPQCRALVREYAQLLVEVARERQQHPLLDENPPDPLSDPEEMARNPLGFVVMGADAPGTEAYSYLGVQLSQQDSGHAYVITGSQAANTPGPRWSDGAARAAVSSTPPAGASLSVTFKPAPADWGAALRQTAEALRLQAVSEEFTRRFQPSLPLDPKGQLSGTLPEILDRLCQTYGYQWRLKDGIYQFRSAHYYTDCQQEPPGTLVKAVRVAREQRQPLDLDWLARAAAATRGQPGSLLWTHAPAAMPVIFQSGSVLRFYSALPPEKRAALATVDGLLASALSVEQQELLMESTRQRSRSAPPGNAAALRVHLTREPRAARFTVTGGEKPVEIPVAYPSAGSEQGRPGARPQ
jgi:beta-lactamase regulating signal transducer with metallopeptidase domain